MHDLPNDPIDPYEARLARRVGAWTEQAVEPFDAAEIARATAVTARRFGVRGALLGRGRSPNLAWVLVAGVLIVAVGGAVIGGGAKGPVGPAATPTAAPPVVAVHSCTPNDVEAVITAWDGAAGSRIATVELHQTGTAPCTVDPLPQPWLADGRGSPLITGKAGAGTPITLAPREVLHTLVQVGNYCGPAPAAPVTVAFTQHGAAFVATALSPTDLSGVPPCNGPTAAAVIEMHPWSR
ncbi:MAG TPA: DUF4232 domain-containing protein [Candidatus Dormibacteraeota bacterium]|nr:DUF4232 domain-containing protein [Candidatus Dormibacteraeota bacterium]